MDCKVCGDQTSFFHYGALCCMSCKVFFRRQMKQDEPPKCRSRADACVINVNTRRNCPACRLAVCYQIGMQKSLIRSAEENVRYRKQVETKRQQLVEAKYQIAPVNSLDVIRVDRSLLSVDQWTLLSNLVHNFDVSYHDQTQQIATLQTTHPFRTRFKLSLYEQLVQIYFQTTKPVLERMPDFQELTLNNRAAITQRTLSYLVSFSAMNNMNVSGFRPYTEKNLQHVYEAHYGMEYIAQAERLREKLHSVFNADVTLFKLFLAILIFTILSPNLSTPLDDEEFNAMALFRLQTRYTDLLWRYMLFRFQHERIVVRLFTGMIHYCLQAQKYFIQLAGTAGSFRPIMDNLTKNIELSLNLGTHLSN